MENIYYLLLVSLIFWYFIYLRRVSEFARKYATKYCESEALQFISIARISSRPRFSSAHGLHWLSIFELEFSGDGESQHIGTVSLRGYKLEKVDLPAYRIH